MGVSGYETCAELEADDDLRARLERIRLPAGPAMRLGVGLPGPVRCRTCRGDRDR